MDFRYEMKMRQTEDRMRALGLMPPTSFLTLDEWEIPRDRVVINRKLGEGAFGTVFGGEAFFDEKGWVSDSCNLVQRATAMCASGFILGSFNHYHSNSFVLPA